MCCNSQIHDELKNMEEPTCPFCDQLLEKGDKVSELCCSEQDMENNNGMNVCLNCGVVHGYVYVNEYIIFMRICIEYIVNRFIIGSTILRMC